MCSYESLLMIGLRNRIAIPFITAVFTLVLLFITHLGNVGSTERRTLLHYLFCNFSFSDGLLHNTYFLWLVQLKRIYKLPQDTRTSGLNDATFVFLHHIWLLSATYQTLPPHLLSICCWKQHICCLSCT